MSIESDLLDLVKGHFSINDVFDESVIIDHVKDNKLPWDVFDEADYVPENLFSDDDLCAWAGENGFVKPEEKE